MSLQLKLAKAQYSGDPGLFSFVGKAVKGVTHALGSGLRAVTRVANVVANPVGAITHAAQSVLGGPHGKALVGVSSRANGLILPGSGGISLGGGLKVGGGQGVQIGGGLSIGGGGAVSPGTAGYHLNKTGYFLKDGSYVAPGTKMVKNRRRNPLNPRALSRSMYRLAGFQKAVTRTQHLVHRLAAKSGGKSRRGPVPVKEVKYLPRPK